MILKALTLENFKGIREPVRIEFAPLTLLFGPNSSGKSTIIKALQLTNTILDRPGLDPFDLAARRGLELGSFRDCVNDRDLSKTIRFTFEMELPAAQLSHDLEGYFDRACEQFYAFSSHNAVPAESLSGIKTATISFGIRYDTSRSMAYISDYRSSLNGVLFGNITYSPSDDQAQVSFLNFCHPLMINVDPQYVTLSAGNETGYDAWLKDADLDGNVSPEEYAGDNSNTALEDFVTENNEAPWDGKPFPFGIVDQKSAIRDADSRMRLAVRKSLPRLADDSDLEMIRYQIACIIITDGLFTPLATLNDLLNHSAFLGPLRDIPSRQRGFQPFQSSGVETLWSNGKVAWEVIKNASDEFISDVNAWLSRPDRLDSGYSIDVVKYRDIPVDHPIMSLIESETDVRAKAEIALADIPVHSRVVLRDKHSGAELSLHDVGVGLSQLLPVIVAALYHESGSITGEHWVSIEQPELHLHPALQVRMADLFISQAQDRKKVFLLETHSEHLMLRVMRRMRETFSGRQIGPLAVKPTDVSVLFVERISDRTVVRQMPLNEAGELVKAWPGGFFEEGLREQFGDD
ncbi:DUF3696 domain-containing protein [uncultured Thiocystis sp.]|jgi:hypothetical protein|uniref:DUF3696 domain-containing protein n=1 Tax=uncultured Thiocystis sp. TaxID=1202134 RepID=UPI0025DA8401|nr:DUF3696 domain-containing protein [uncultured Thiocystis sp.]